MLIANNNWRKAKSCDHSKYAQPILISPAFRKLIETATGEDKESLRKQVEFSSSEKKVGNYETADPLGEQKYCITPYLVHQYDNRVLLLSTGKCLAYCRYCFRRGFTARQESYINDEELNKVCAYISDNPEIEEILVSGGDPMSGGFKNLKRVLTALRKNSEKLIIRLCSRSPIFAPELFTEEVLALLEDCKPLWLIPHINHSAELGEAQRKAFSDCQRHGIAIQSQTVLLKGVNDKPETLIKLFNELTRLGIKPGYLFQLDLAAGTAHFRVPLKEAMQIWKVLERKLSGLSRPHFAVDLPNGGGKFQLSALSLSDKIIEKKADGSFSAIGCDGQLYEYRADF